MDRFGEHLNSKNTTKKANEEAENAKSTNSIHIQNHNDEWNCVIVKQVDGMKTRKGMSFDWKKINDFHWNGCCVNRRLVISLFYVDCDRKKR